ncbi:hypothetical protein ACQPZF_02900 [Actinosynnema sp. CS-041913]|uniref:hypothetical protein n=1 Tax=Actinosynnema sp. CS-041913 TaxID=3239917 RepID=UPI003D8D1DD8
MRHPGCSPSLAGALINLGMMPAHSGDLKAARHRAREAAALLRGPSREDARLLPDLAKALHNLGSYLARSGRRAEALVPVGGAGSASTAPAEA